MTVESIETVAAGMRRFQAGVVADSPLYGRLSAAVAEMPEVLTLLTERQAGQPAGNLLFAAVQYLLLKRFPDDPLAMFYPSLGRHHDGDPLPAFAAFCRSHAQRVRSLVKSRRTNTAAPGRAAVLLAGLAEVSRRTDWAPMHLIEIGAGLGTNLLFDRYTYDYVGGLKFNPSGPLVLRCVLRGGGQPPIDEARPFPSTVSRTGVELVPVDPFDDDAMLWLRALIYPDAAERHAQFGAIAGMIRETPPPVIKGDATTDLPNLFAQLNPGGPLVVMHSQVTYQIDEPGRAAIRAALADEAHRRPVFRVGLEWVTSDAQLGLVDYAGLNPRVERLGICQSHGQWLDWGLQPATEEELGF